MFGPLYIASLISLGSFLTVSASIGPVTDLTIVNADITPDGFMRQAVLANGVYPGPAIVGNKGDNFQINVQDSLTNETMNMTTTIHWHGIFQHTTNWADGPAFVTQCPISPSNSFLYNFTVPNQAGTFWYHSHESLQYCDGLRGPFIVYDPDDPYADLYDVDDETTIVTLSDWYHLPALQVPLPANPESTLINGLGRQANDTTSPLTVITVEPGLRYRIRLISLSCSPYFTFSIDNHTGTIIEADGQNTQALPGIDSIPIFASQRYSFVLEANQPVGNYWIRAASEALGSPATPPGFAILRYEGAPEEEPTTPEVAPVNPLVETNLHPLTNPTPPGAPGDDGADVSLNLDVTFDAGRFYVNGATFLPPSVPVLLQILHGSYTAQELLPPGSVYSLPMNQTIQISIPGGLLGDQHPIHLHGHVFSVLRSAGNESYNYVDPVRRDTVNTGLKGDNVTIRFQTDNPGPWFLHCHIDFHLNAGFAVVMAEATNMTAEINVPSVAWDSLCPDYDDLPAADH
ncbi:multicopper oxidase [Laetiporus sulphureus 93-53]|uniref:laccase n=1 Tax=Laetiporus sulphureus 93-53 TaxID=1314785 RepID=A0A165B9R4_9APHY|nr:multicopper oxidase [Laetiporus sulphureus 93-53]KZT00572.1 multicopper oxidase [Laetiporus sulphureus 93-53]